MRVYVYVYIIVCMCGEHFSSVSVGLWGSADESTLIDENPPLEGLLASLSVPLQVTGKGLCLGLHSGEWGYQGLIQREESHDILPYPLCNQKTIQLYTVLAIHCIYITCFHNNLPEACITVTHNNM